MKDFKKKMFLLYSSLCNILRRESIAVNVFYTEDEKGVILHKNWGDDLNLFLLRLISGRNVYAANKSILHNKFKFKNYSCIGSILGMFENEKTEVWGAGFISENSGLLRKPFKIHSVRGKLTRKKLLALGIECPENYGDPALLVSRFYNAKPCGRYRVGIIPHYVDLSNSLIKKIVDENDDILLIDVAHYNKWTDICDMVVSCDYIISSSLHGLILSDSYGIPNRWIKFSDKIYGGNFKYLDYFSSVDRQEINPILINSMEDFNDMMSHMCEIKSLNKEKYIELILRSCPFK